MRKDSLIVLNSENNIMEDNLFLKTDRFVDIVTDKNSMCVFLSVAKNAVIQIDDLINDTELGLKDVANSLDKLEEGDFVKRNPHPLSEKYRLGFNGQLFAEQLRATYPEVKELLGDKRLIEPLKEI